MPHPGLAGVEGGGAWFEELFHAGAGEAPGTVGGPGQRVAAGGLPRIGFQLLSRPIVLQFSKYQGLGNDFLMLDGRGAAPGDETLGLTPELVRRLCDRRFGVGGDGVILALPPRGEGELRMRIFNADGTEPEMCGNGIRCLARFLADSDGDAAGRRWEIETLAGRIVPELQEGGTIRVDMGAPFLEPAAVPTTLPLGEAGIPQGSWRRRAIASPWGPPAWGIPTW